MIYTTDSVLAQLLNSCFDSGLSAREPVGRTRWDELSVALLFGVNLTETGFQSVRGRDIME